MDSDDAMTDRVDPARVIADLRELAALSTDRRGAQRVAFTEVWEKARAWLRAKLAELPVEVAEDGARNLWVTLAGGAEPAVAIGSHLDSVPDGGWLDGALGVLAGLEILRAAGPRPARSLVLVDWADEEGRFGHSLLGSSASTGTLDVEALDVKVGAVLDLDGLRRAGQQRPRLHAYLELHIEQGPILESEGTALAVVAGTYGVRRARLRFGGQAAHAGATPLAARRDPVLAAARFIVDARRLAGERGGLATVGVIEAEPATPTAVARECGLVVDTRHARRDALVSLHSDLLDAAAAIAHEERVTVEHEVVWSIDPIAFDRELVALAGALLAPAARRDPLTSGPLHDAAAMARAGVPSVMLFVRSLGGISHSPAEDSDPEDLAAAVRALAELTAAASTRFTPRSAPT
ncbi:MAG TPA: Zn-dependent hydrolase [Solirubrobacteraceae bacterium]|nr:Zn-dependent hydrolase [Solirubrobacteraceae bacterium]